MTTQSIEITPKVEREAEARNYGKFVISPLERGYGVTLGNALYNGPLFGLAHDAIEPVRRMCRWIANEISEGVTDSSPLS